MSEKIEKELYTIIIEDSTVDHIPLFCSTCELPMIGGEDNLSYNEFNSCNHCSTMWAYQDKERWLNGERPSQETIDKDKELRIRVSNKFIL